MAPWPEHPQAETIEGVVQAAMRRLAQGPDPSLPVTPYVVGVSCHPLPEVRYEFHQARHEHFPGPENPSHLLVWTRSSSHIFDYHSVNYACIGA